MSGVTVLLHVDVVKSLELGLVLEETAAKEKVLKSPLVYLILFAGKLFKNVNVCTHCHHNVKPCSNCNVGVINLERFADVCEKCTGNNNI